MSKILFAEDDEAMRDMVADILRSAGHAVSTVSDGTRALSQIRAESPDLVILDYRMGNPDGIEVCRRIKGDPRLAHLPVLILTAQYDVEDRLRGFEAGANDYLAKPFDARELLARVGSLLRLSEQGRELNPTTGLPGGRAIEREIARLHDSGTTFTLGYLDLDNFKAFNDRFGFASANLMIEALGEILRDAVADTGSFAAHIGGDDFLVLCAPADARSLVERVQREFRKAIEKVVPEEILERGSYRGRGREGTEEEIPLTRVAAALLTLGEAVPTFARLGEIAADAKQLAKEPGSRGIVEMAIGEEAI